MLPSTWVVRAVVVASVCFVYQTLAATLYVWPNSPSPSPPYADWQTAAHTIQDAVNAAASNDTVLVTNGVYDTGGALMPGYTLFCRVVITNGVQVVSVNGPSETVIVGAGPMGTAAVRCAYLSQGASLCGFTLTNGHTASSGSLQHNMSGGGAYIRDSGTISNCVIAGNRASHQGGGVMCYGGGRILNSILCGNHATNNAGGGAFFEGAGLMSNCVVHGNTARWDGGGVTISYTGLVTHSVLYGNLARDGDGGGVDLYYGGGVSHCLVYSNRAGGLTEFDGGGGIQCYFGGGVTNSAIFGNSAATRGGGVKVVFGGTIVQCSIFDNAAADGGGVYGDYYMTNLNTIIYHNHALAGPNWSTNGRGNAFWASCTTPLPPGGGNITNDPRIAGVRNWHLLTNSPCVNAGSNAFAAGIALDLDGEPRISGAAVDIGCDEQAPAALTGPLAVLIRAATTQVVVNVPLTFYSDVSGKVARTEWTIQTDSGTRGNTNVFVETQSWSTPGVYSLVLSALNNDTYAAATVSVTVLSGFTNYVAKGGSPTAPFTSWATAATSVYDAVQASPPGGVTLVSNGVFEEDNEIVLDKPATIIGVNGPAVTEINGRGKHRVFRIAGVDGRLYGLTIANGNSGADVGGGVLMEAAGVLSNCWIVGNVSSNDGAGVYLNNGGTLFDCVIATNRGPVWGCDGGGAYFHLTGTAQRCRFERNLVVGNGGGVYFNYGGAANDAVLLANVASNGGGGAYCYYGGALRNVIARDNVSYNGGGVYFNYGGRGLNAHVASNYAQNSGGGLYLYGSSSITCSHATVQGNVAGVRGGGVYASYGGNVLNSIIYYNRAPLGENYFNDSSGYRYNTCCMTPMPSSGAANILTNEPLFAGVLNPHLMAGSPCIDFGSNAFAEGIAVDVDGEPRTNGVAVDVGCDEFWAASMTGALSVAITAPFTTAVVDTPLPFTANVEGKATSIVWQVGDVGLTNGFTNALTILYAWPNVGNFPVVLWAHNASGSASATVSVAIVESATNYVDLANPTPAYPYTNWATAATSIQPAVDAAPVGGVVLVSNGNYLLTAEITLTKPVRLMSVNGPDTVTVDGQGARRVFNISAQGTMLSGFTVANGFTDGNGGGILCGPGVVITNCRIANCRAASGGGVFFNGGGAIYNSRFEYNQATTAGGGLYCMVGGAAYACEFHTNRTTSASSGGGGGAYVNTAGIVVNCAFTNNRSAYRGGGATAYFGGIFSNCFLARNEAASGGGLYLQYGARAVGCVISNNAATQENGGGVFIYFNSTVEDCLVVTNSAYNSGGGVYIDSVGTVRRTTVDRNVARWVNGGGIYFSRGGVADQCVLTFNRAPSGAGGGAYLDRMSLGLTNCQINGNSARDGAGAYINGSGLVLDSSFSNNIANWDGGGSFLGGGGSLVRCTFWLNSASRGGGAYLNSGGLVSNSVFRGNMAGQGGGVGAIFGGRVHNSFFADNLATNSGGGLALFTFGTPTEVAHCTVVGNTCYGEGGGLFTDLGGLIRNTILYDNRAPLGNNWFNDGGTPATYDHCCTTPNPGGAGHITAPPLLAGRFNPHLLTNSPCVNAGNLAWAVGLDIDMEPRVFGPAPDIGCDEVVPTNLAGPLTVGIFAPATQAVVQTPLTFVSDVQGRVQHLEWQVDTGSGTTIITNATEIEPVWSAAGEYAVVLSAWNSTAMGAATVTVQVLEPQTNYVAPGGAHIWPFATWANASTSIAEAVAAAAHGAVVAVSNGVYREQPGILVDKPLTIRGVNGWENTTMDGQGQWRCFIVLDTNVLIEGFTFSNGFARADLFAGGGAVVLAGGGTVRHCRFVNCNAVNYGGGALCYQGGSLQNCWFTGNTAMFGGGVLCYQGGEVVNSTLTGNRAFAQGGGVYCEGGGSVLNTLSYYNNSAMGANWFNVGDGIFYANVCSDPLPPGPGNFTNAPALAGLNNPHLLTNSPCINAGSNAFAAAIAQDCDGEPRILDGRVEVGVDEVYPSGLTGSLAVAIGAATLRTAPGVPLGFWAYVQGRAVRTVWAADTGAGWRTETNTVYFSHTWTATGSYAVTLFAFNNTDLAGATVTVTVVNGTTRYVAKSGLHNPPFLSWEDAANTISAAVAVASAGDTILITNDVYAEGTEIVLDKPVRVVGVNGPEVTIVDGANTHRVFRVEHAGAVLEGLGIRRGNARYSPGSLGGGGVVINGAGTVIGCHIYSNQAPQYAAGVLLYGGGTVTGCVIRHNRTEIGAGAQLFNGGLLTHSRIWGNEATGRGGGVDLTLGGVVSNCWIQKNVANVEGGGVNFHEGGLVVNCEISTNQAVDGGGAFFYMGGTLLNSVVQSNFSWFSGGGARMYKGGIIRNCLLHRNAAEPQWGIGWGGGVYLRLGGTVENCTIVRNLTATNHGGGIACNGGGTVLNTIIYSNRIENLANPEQGTFQYCCIVPAPAGTMNFTNNPQFMDWAAWDYRLASNSPCVEQGLNQDWMTNAVDLDATARLKNLYVDIGAYESVWTNVDTDGDGLSVGTERSQFGTSDFLTDTDGDTQGDWDEAMITGTSPSDGSLYFRGLIRMSGSKPVLYWPSITDRLYGVETVTDLATGQWTAVPGWTNVPGTAGFMYYTNDFPDPLRHFRPSVTRTNW